MTPSYHWLWDSTGEVASCLQTVLALQAISGVEGEEIWGAGEVGLLLVVDLLHYRLFGFHMLDKHIVT